MQQSDHPQIIEMSIMVKFTYNNLEIVIWQENDKFVACIEGWKWLERQPTKELAIHAAKIYAANWVAY